MDIKIINDQGKVETKDTLPMDSKRNVDALALPEMESRAIGQVMGLEKDSEFGQYQDKIQTLLDYAKSQTDDHSLENLKWVVRSLELKLGTPPFAEKRITWLSRYAYLSTEEAKLKKEKEVFERGTRQPV